jgi:hypothetical protein
MCMGRSGTGRFGVAEEIWRIGDIADRADDVSAGLVKDRPIAIWAAFS